MMIWFGLMLLATAAWQVYALVKQQRVTAGAAVWTDGYGVFFALILVAMGIAVLVGAF